MSIKLIILALFISLSGLIKAQSIDSLAWQSNLILSQKSISKDDFRIVIDLADSLKLKKPLESIDLLEKLIPHFTKKSDTDLLEIEASIIYAESLSHTNKLDSCEQLLIKTLEKFVSKERDSLFINKLGKLHQQLAFVYMDKSLFVKAAEHYNHAAVYFDQSGDQQNQLASKYNQANLQTRIGNLEAAKKCYEEMLEITDKPLVIGVVYNSLGILYMKKEDYSEALKKLLKSEELIEYAREPELTYLNLSVAYRYLEEYKLAEEKLLLAEKICEEKNHSRNLILITNGLAKLYNDTEQLDLALKYLKKNEDLISPSNYNEFAVIYETKSRIYEKKQDWKNAFDYIKLKQIYADSIEAIDKFETITEIEAKYQTEKKEAENQLLKKEKELQAATIQQQKTSLIGTIIGLSLLALLSLLLYKRNKERKRTNEILQSQKNKIEALHKELSHRVKNNLHFMSSLLHLQGKKLDDDNAKQAIKEGEARLQAMSLLHRRLGLDEHKGKINLGSYIKEICSYLQVSFPNSEIQPNIEVKSEDIYIDAEYAMRLGIIVNELVTNSIKHAFIHQSEPKISAKIHQDETGKLSLDYQDNGKGLPNDYNEKQESFGMKLINILTKQLKGNMKIAHSTGTHLVFIFDNISKS